MKLQNLLLPKVGICTEEGMFFHREADYERELEFLKAENVIHFHENARCFFDTYFNSLSIAKWKKYTTLKDVELRLELQGDFEVVLLNFERIGGAQERFSIKIVNSTIIHADSKSVFSFPYKLYEYRGLLGFELKALSEGAQFLGGWYEGDIEEDSLFDVDIAINICTFKREPFVLRNLDILRKKIIEDHDNPLSEHLRVYISDNGRTLPSDQLNDDFIRIVPNKNVGGAGGFTRGLLEIMKDSGRYSATHALMMDDDIIIEPEALYRTYALLRCRKEEYKDMFIGGAMLRLDEQNIQVESGASWNAGSLVSNKAGLNLNNTYDVIYNELEEYVEYNAWWYCCMPMSVVSPRNLPLPIFIRGDDLEFGLRNMKTLVLLSGICVWHEAFENKYSSFLKYYILRNLLYDNALHFRNFGMINVLIRLYKDVLRELIYYRYKNIDLLFRGVNDYLKGVKFLLETDGEQLHKDIMAEGYKGEPIEQLPGAALHLLSYYDSLEETEGRLRRIFRLMTVNGYLLPVKRGSFKTVSMAQCRPINFFRQARVLNYDPASNKGFITEKSWKETFKAGWGLVKITFRILSRYKAVKTDFQKNYTQVTNETFWNGYLSMD